MAHRLDKLVRKILNTTQHILFSNTHTHTIVYLVAFNVKHPINWIWRYFVECVFMASIIPVWKIRNRSNRKIEFTRSDSSSLLSFNSSDLISLIFLSCFRYASDIVSKNIRLEANQSKIGKKTVRFIALQWTHSHSNDNVQNYKLIV